VKADQIAVCTGVVLALRRGSKANEAEDGGECKKPAACLRPWAKSGSRETKFIGSLHSKPHLVHLAHTLSNNSRVLLIAHGALAWASANKISCSVLACSLVMVLAVEGEGDMPYAAASDMTQARCCWSNNTILSPPPRCSTLTGGGGLAVARFIKPPSQPQPPPCHLLALCSSSLVDPPRSAAVLASTSCSRHSPLHHAQASGTPRGQYTNPPPPLLPPSRAAPLYGCATPSSADFKIIICHCSASILILFLPSIL